MANEAQMRAQETSYPPLTHPVSVITSQFLTPHPVDLTVIRKLVSVTDGNFAVADCNGKLLFKIKGALLSLHDRRSLLDASDRPLASLRQKIFSAHRRWQVFRGESSNSEDLIFSAKRSSLVQFRTELDVFLASNTKEEVCDFKVKGSYLERSCTIYAGDGNTVIAHMHKQHTMQSMFLGKDTFTVTVYPNIDYAFIVALIVILDEINEDDDSD